MLSVYHQLAKSLGSPIEVLEEGEWIDTAKLRDWHSSTLRVADPSIAALTDELVAKHYSKLNYEGYDYIVANAALKTGAHIVIFDIILEITEMGYRELTEDEAEIAAKNTLYTAHTLYSFYADESDIVTISQ